MLNRKSIIKKLETIEKLILEIKKDIEKEPIEPDNSLNKPQVELPSEDQLREEYELLYKNYYQGEAGVIEEFIKNKTKKYLQFFCRVNSFPINTSKTSKEGIMEEILQIMAQRKAINW